MVGDTVRAGVRVRVRVRVRLRVRIRVGVGVRVRVRVEREAHRVKGDRPFVREPLGEGVIHGHLAHVLRVRPLVPLRPRGRPRPGLVGAIRLDHLVRSGLGLGLGLGLGC